MATKAALIGKLPSQDLDGLGAAAPKIEQSPDETITAIVRLKVRKTEYDQETGDVLLKMGVEQIEIARGIDEVNCLRVMRQGAETRTGAREITGFDAAGVINLGGVDTGTGESPDPGHGFEGYGLEGELTDEEAGQGDPGDEE